MSFKVQREAMVKLQLAGRDITHQATLDAMRKVERHRFIPEGLRECAYEDRPLAIGEGQTISQPYMVAIMTQCLRLSGEERVLEIGAGSGYQTAILAELARHVFTVERIEPLLSRAREVLTALDYRNIFFRCGDGSEGWADQAPFDRILVTAAAPRVPSSLLSQLAAGGKLVIPIGPRSFQQLQVLTKDSNDQMTVESYCGCVFVPLVGREGWRGDE